MKELRNERLGEIRGARRRGISNPSGTMAYLLLKPAEVKTTPGLIHEKKVTAAFGQVMCSSGETILQIRDPYGSDRRYIPVAAL